MGSGIARGAAALALSTLLTGCVASVPYRGEQHTRTVRYEQYASIPQLERTVVREERHHTIERLVLREHGSEVTIDHYRAKIEGPRPLVMVSPSLGIEGPGSTLLFERPFITYFSERGLDVALVYRPAVPHTSDPVGDIERTIGSAVHARRRALDVLLGDPTIAREKICSLGISMGGFIETVAAAQDPRIACVAIGLAGSLRETFAAASDQSPLALLREIAAAAHERGRATFFADMDERVTSRPENYAHLLDPARTMLVIATKDTIVPRAATEDLRARIGEPYTLYLRGVGHFGSFARVRTIREKVYEFIRDRIGGAPPAVPDK